ncbi:hypothetical+protein [Methylocapsa aurea]|uniref:DUF2158 domain-containing protein n=1 Tax=Methylocapsa aurea TaxID=663610 RepID=UPI003D18EA6E
MAKQAALGSSLEDFNVGDIVRLNCSTLRMTVDKIDPDNAAGAIECIWFDDSDTLNGAPFYPSQLVIVNKAG